MAKVSAFASNMIAQWTPARWLSQYHHEVVTEPHFAGLNNKKRTLKAKCFCRPISKMDTLNFFTKLITKL